VRCTKPNVRSRQSSIIVGVYDRKMYYITANGTDFISNFFLSCSTLIGFHLNFKRSRVQYNLPSIPHAYPGWVGGWVGSEGLYAPFITKIPYFYRIFGMFTINSTFKTHTDYDSCMLKETNWGGGRQNIPANLLQIAHISIINRIQ